MRKHHFFPTESFSTEHEVLQSKGSMSKNEHVFLNKVCGNNRRLVIIFGWTTVEQQKENDLSNFIASGHN